MWHHQGQQAPPVSILLQYKSVTTNKMLILRYSDHTVLLLATVIGGKAISETCTGAMADQFRSADGKKDISEMFHCAVRGLRKKWAMETICQCPEFRKTTNKPLIVPPASKLQ